MASAPTVAELTYWMVIASHHASVANPLGHFTRLVVVERELRMVAKAERFWWREAAQSRRDNFEDWAREAVVFAFLFRSARRALLADGVTYRVENERQ